jgi:hypothetical protein
VIEFYGMPVVEFNWMDGEKTAVLCQGFIHVSPQLYARLGEAKPDEIPTILDGVRLLSVPNLRMLATSSFR